MPFRWLKTNGTLIQFFSMLSIEISQSGLDRTQAHDIGLDILRSSPPPSPLLDTLFALQEFVY